MAVNLTNLVYHIIFCPKNRQPLLLKELRSELFNYITGIIRKKSGILIDFGCVEDHMHLLAKFSPKYSVSEMLKHIKGSSSHWINEKQFLSVKFRWQQGYGAFTVSEKNVTSLKKYLLNQEAHHRKISFNNELKEILTLHSIKFNDDFWATD